jgi:glucosamine-6-phosphate deaminase
MFAKKLHALVSQDMSDSANSLHPLPYRSSFLVDALSVRIYDNPSLLAADAATIAHHYLISLLTEKDSASILLATGDSQIQFLQQLIALGGIDWSKITLFHLDEYLGIAGEHPASFRYYLHEKVEKLVRSRQFNYINGDCLLPIAECRRYGELLQQETIDLCFLGIGENGHLAFNDPDVTDFDDSDAVKLVKLDDRNRQQQFQQGNFPTLASVPQYAFTVTIPAICRAKKIICLASTARKAKIVEEMLTGAIATHCPASILRKQPQATLFLDREAASLINLSRI